MHPLVLSQLCAAFGPAGPEDAAVRAFAQAVSTAYEAADEDRRQLERSIDLASAELRERHRDMSMILDHVAQGFVTVGLDGKLGKECSRALVTWFGALPPDARVWSYIFDSDPSADWVELAWASLAEGVMPLDVVLAQLPNRIVRGDAHFRVQYLTIGEPVRSLLVVITDITGEIARELADQLDRDLATLVKKVGRDRRSLVRFVADTDALATRCCEALHPADVRRYLHTLKGNAALFGIASLAELCHRLEEHSDDGLDEIGRALLSDTWQQLRERIDSTFELPTHDAVVVERAQFDAVIAAIGTTDAPWATELRAWAMLPARAQLEQLGEHAMRLARKLDKPEPEIEIEDHGIKTDPERLAEVWQALVHVVRNAVDHGIEPAEHRIAAGKEPQGRLVLRSDARGDQIMIEVADDGGGIDWAAIDRRAGAMGIAARGNAALFAQGLSTRMDVSEISGRGIGMGAVHAACAGLGGRVDVISVLGAGTTVRCVIPN
ncbi:MAG TPA: ATP-binding protein, partial [Kofleriaceae bacterium]|nr:ATP-binding protein [Kofleriaceae bacterium]